MLNRSMLIGNLGADPEIRYLPSGDAIATIRLATSRRYKNKQTNERVEETEWHRVVFFGGLAKIVGEHLKKGAQIYVEGRIRTHKWQDKDGQDRFTTEIIAESMNMLGRKEGGGNRPPAESYQSKSNKVPDRSAPQSGAGGGHQDGPPASAYGNIPGSYDDFDDDIPF